MDNEKKERYYYNWNLAFLISALVILMKVCQVDDIENIPWWWLTICLWLPFPLLFIISLIRNFFNH